MKKGFTLIELLVVIAIIAVIATATILVINPAELIKQGRDSTRLSDLNNINRSLGFLQVDNPTTSFGTSSIVYVSIPDTSATCANLGLPSLPGGWAYACATDANHRKTDGNGWIPADFTSFSAGSPLSVLPIDPINTTSTGNYYTYVTGGSWELTALFESVKHTEKAGNDGGPDPAQYETGTSLTLSPFAHGLTGYWKLDDGSGSSVVDSSGFGTTGTLRNSPTWTSGSCKIGGCLSFDETNDVQIPDGGWNKAAPYSLTVWYNRTGGTGADAVLDHQLTGGIRGAYVWLVHSSRFAMYDGDMTDTGCSNVSGAGSAGWHLFVAAFTTTELKCYLDGSLAVTVSIQNMPKVGGAFYLASRGEVPDYYFLGYIDEVRFYNRTLSAAEIQAIYNATQ